MIIVDTNVVAYCWIRGMHTALAQELRSAEPEWHAPIFWRSEFRNVLCNHLKRGTLDLDAVHETWASAAAAMIGREHQASGAVVLDIAAQTGLSAYGAEFVAVAEALNVPLVTGDREILEAYSGAISIEDFLERRAKGPGVHSPVTPYRAKPSRGRITRESRPARVPPSQKRRMRA